jgi:hypothetical protein
MTPVIETLRLTAHEKFILDGIRRQAGSVEKAVLELVMNAVEAQLATGKKPRVEIAFNGEGDGKLVVSDQGRGFKNRVEIEEWFAKFGTPHDECPECKKTMKLQGENFVCPCGYQTEGRTWAEFRMGRGQAFSFGRNIWRTGTFLMEYDLETDPDKRAYAKSDGDNHILDFQLKSNLPNKKGCEVTVYFYENPVGQGKYYNSLEAFKEKITHHVKFMEGEILFNGEQINTPASECQWDMETDDAYFSFGAGHNLSLYNIGAFVTDYDAAFAGVTGAVVSKPKMQVNFARNDVQQSCPVYKRIWVIVRENKIKKVRRAQRYLTNNERTSMLIDLRDGLCEYADAKTLSLFDLADGKRMSLDAVKKIRSPWTFAPEGSRIADRLMQTDKAICFSEELIDTLSYTGDPRDFFEWLLTNIDTYGDGIPAGWEKVKSFHRPFTGEEGLADGISDVCSIVPTSKLSKAERRFLKVLDDYDCWDGRTICIGVSETNAGWTDGRTYIAINRNYLHRNNPKYYEGASAIVTLMWHEMAHDEDDRGTHLHGPEFHKRYHVLTYGRHCWMIGNLPGKLSNQKWQDRAQEEAEKQAKKQARLDAKIGLVKNGKPKKVAAKADGLTHTPTKPRVKVKRSKVSKRVRRF